MPKYWRWRDPPVPLKRRGEPPDRLSPRKSRTDPINPSDKRDLDRPDTALLAGSGASRYGDGCRIHRSNYPMPLLYSSDQQVLIVGAVTSLIRADVYKWAR